MSDVLAIRLCDETRESLSNVMDWEFSREWIRSVTDLITPKAYAGFLLRVSTRQASMNKKWQAFLPLLWEAFKNGEPRVKDLLSFFLLWLIPTKLRQKLRHIVS